MSRIIHVNKIITTILTLILPLIFGAPIRSSNSYWVFWYYNNDGNRSCGNYCYIVFSLVGAILLCICGCGCLRCYLVRRRFKSERLESNMNTQQILERWDQEERMAEQNHQNQIIAQQQLQYPPLAHNSQYNHDSEYPNILRDITPPPYDNNAYNAEIQKHALRQVESNWTAYKAGKDFTRNNPPNEILPPQDHSNYIKGLGGVEAWRFVPESSILQLNIASVTDNYILSFHAKLDAMMQSNYPLIDMKYSTSNEDTNNHNSSSSYSSPSTSSTITFPSSDNNRKDKKSSNTLTVNTASTMNSMNLNDSSNNTSPMTVHSKSNLLSAPNSPPFPPPTNNINTNMITDHSTTSRSTSSSSPPPPPPPPYIPQSFALQPPTDSWFFYYEITIQSNPNKETTIAIGLATKPYPTFRLPGWNNHSVGYHSNEGRKFHNEGLTGRKYAEKWGDANDVIGCGYYPDTGQVFFTKNGVNQGIAYTGLFHIWFPTIGSDGVCSLKVNFGQEEFIYKPANGTSVAGIIPKNITDQSIEEEQELDEKNMNESVT